MKFKKLLKLYREIDKTTQEYAYYLKNPLLAQKRVSDAFDWRDTLTKEQWADQRFKDMASIRIFHAAGMRNAVFEDLGMEHFPPFSRPWEEE